MAEKVFTFEEVAKHNKKDDCWLIISGKVYDVSLFLEDHPGGDDVILTATGKDATMDFEEVGHSTDAMSKRDGLFIGYIDKSTLPGNEQHTVVPPSTANSESGDSKFLLYVLPLLILGVALLLRFYSKKEEV